MRRGKFTKSTRLIIILMLVTISISFGQSYRIVETGQTKFYNAASEITEPSKGETFYGQDAHFPGLERAYQDNGDGTVTDLNTGFMWQKGLPDDKYPYDDCVVYADTCTLAGYSDWRLPTIKELYSLMLFSGVTGMTESNSVPYIDTDYFEFRFGGETDPNERFIDAQYATSTIYKGTTMGASETMFGLNLVDGRIKGYPTRKNFEIKLVRGNENYGVNDFIDNGDGTITDNATGLMWEQNGDNGGMNWEDALALAQQRNAENYLEYNDWRLPNAKELHSIVDYNRSPSYTSSAAISPMFNVPVITDENGEDNYPFYWTSTTHVDGPWPNKAVYICFGEALGYMNYNWIDVHGAGAQRSDPKDGDPANYPTGFGPQGDAIRINNYVRLVRTMNSDDPVGGGESGGDGYTLFAPLGNTGTYLIDGDGEVINSWESDNAPALSAYLLNDKSLLRTTSQGRNSNSVFGNTGGAGGRVEKFDWEGNKIWEFDYNSDEHLLHHDVEYLPNGNILMIAWEYKNSAEAIDAGRNPSLLSDNDLWADKIIEVEPNENSGGTIVWEWHVWDHLIQDYDASKTNYGIVSDHPGKIDINFVANQPGADWTHINGIDYNEELDQVLLTVRNFSEIWIIDHNTTTAEAAGSAGDLLYRWGNPQTYGRGADDDQQLLGPHDGQWIKTGYPGENDILIFNNGQGRNYSSVDQITPPLDFNGDYTVGSGSAFGPDELTWTYTGDPASSFYANHISGAQRLSNGNTLICEGTQGRFFEVTTEGEIVWEYINPYSFTTPQGNEVNEVFRAVRYIPEDFDGGDITTSVEENENNLPDSFLLSQNYPNPFNPATKIKFSIPGSIDLKSSQQIKLKVFDILGNEISTLVDEIKEPGNYEVSFDGWNMASGIYYYQLKAGDFIQTKKMILLK